MTETALRDMLALITAHADRERSAILEQARVEAARLVRSAHRDARARMHQTLVELRSQMRREVAQADAMLETARRQHQAHCELMLLTQADRPLREGVIARWRDQASRKIWVDHIVAQARTVLPATAWEVEHAPGWPARERDALGQTVAGESGHAPTFTEQADIAAGLRLCAKGACLDGTAESLLADRDAIHARLLAGLNA